MQGVAAPQVSETVWAGAYGVLYSTKFIVDWTERIPFLRAILDHVQPKTVLDVGTNAGFNLRAIREIDESIELKGLEINSWVAQASAAMGFNTLVVPARMAHHFGPFDLAITSGVLIHVDPEILEETMQSIAASAKWVLAIEYAAPECIPKEGCLAPTYKRPYGRLYEKAGLTLEAEGDSARGYPECAWWLLKR